MTSRALTQWVNSWVEPNNPPGCFNPEGVEPQGLGWFGGLR
jgi:hypothetical protein